LSVDNLFILSMDMFFCYYVGHMASWATKRKFAYTILIVGFLIFVVGVPSFLFFYETPTCFDGKLNQNEQGIDCGGKCAKLCSSAFLPAIIVWSRATEVEPGIYNLLAYVENPNLDGAAENVPYLFKVYDKQGILIVERSGSINMPAHKNVPVFESAVQTGNRMPATVTFELKKAPEWHKDTAVVPEVVVTDKALTNLTGEPKITAMVENRTIKPVLGIEAVAIVFDINDNAIAFSKTRIDAIAPGQSERIAFTWPNPFKMAPARFEIIVTVLKDN
jgi:hypothetical protein